MAYIQAAPLPSLGSLFDPTEAAAASVNAPAPLPFLASVMYATTSGGDLVADAGSFTFAGVNAVLRYGHHLDAEVGEFTLTGIDATLAVPEQNQGGEAAPLPFLSSLFVASEGSFVLYAWDGPGVFTLTGNAANMRRGHGIVCEPGSFVLTGAPSFSDHEMHGTTGAFVFTGIAATLKRNPPGIAAEAGAFTLTGRDAALVYEQPGVARSMFCEAGDFALTGVDATFPARGRRLVTEAGAFILTGKPATLIGPSWVNTTPAAADAWTRVPRGSETWTDL